MATLAFHSSTGPLEFEDMDPADSAELAKHVIEMAKQDAEHTMNLMKAQTEAITKTFNDGVVAIIKSNQSTLAAIAKSMKG